MLLLYLLFAVLLFHNKDKHRQMVRAIVPAYALLGWQVLPAAINVRRVKTSVKGVQIRNLPIPKGKNFDITRDQIRSVTTRHIQTTAGDQIMNLYVAGIDTDIGQVDLTYTYPTYEEATAIADRFAASLNHGPITRRIKVTTTTQEPEHLKALKKTILLWLGAYLVAILMGVYWGYFTGR